MTFALTLLVLLAPGDEAMSGPLAAAARATLGENTTIELRILPAPGDDAALALARDARARGTAVIVWADAGKQRARIRLLGQLSGRIVEREIDFEPDDAPEEKGRTLGFALASMLPESEEPLASAAEPPEPILVLPPVTAPPPAPPPPAVAIPPAVPWTFAIDAAVQAALAIAGAGTGFGGELAGQYRLSDHLAVRAGAALRLGHLEVLEARTTIVDLGPGLVWRSRDPEPGRRFALALRVDAFARLQSVTRSAQAGIAAESHVRFVPGVGVGLEAMYALTRELGVFAESGAHVLLGETEVVLRGKQVATFAPVGLALEFGGRARF